MTAPSVPHAVDRSDADVGVVSRAGGPVSIYYAGDRPTSREAAAVVEREIAHENLALADAAVPTEVQERLASTRITAVMKRLSGGDVGRASIFPALLLTSMLVFLTFAATNLPIEKDQRTSEALLAFPIDQRSIILAKTLFVGLVATASGGLGIAIAWCGSLLTNGDRAVETSALGLGVAVLMVLGCAMFMSSAGMLIGVFAKSVNEATAVAALCSLPLMLLSGSLFLIHQTRAGLALIPLFGQLVVLRDTFEGTSSVGSGVLAFGVTALLSTALLALAHRNMRNETFVLRSVT